MNNQPANPTCNSHVRPEDLMEEMGVKTNTYYRDVNFLNIEAIKDDEGKTWITIEDAERIKALRKYVQETGKRQGFEDNGINKNQQDEVKPENSEPNLVVSENNSLSSNSTANSDDIYVAPEEPTNNMNIDGLVREAAELKAREVAMPDLVKRAIADKMTEEDLPEDLKEKVNLAREAANPKFTPSMVAKQILERYRQGKVG